MKEAQATVAKLGYPLQQPDVMKWSEEERLKSRNMIVRLFSIYQRVIVRFIVILVRRFLVRHTLRAYMKHITE